MSVRLYAMTCGWLTMPAPIFLRGRAGSLVVPVPSYLVVHPKGTAVFDTGLETALQSQEKEVRKKALGALEPVTATTYIAGEELGGRLRAFERDPSKIDFMVSSHLHFDHVGGNDQLPNARWVVQKREWDAAHTPEGQRRYGYQLRHVEHGHDRLLVDGEHDLFGDGSVTLVPSYGHTPGHQSMRVKLADGDVVMTGDACYFRQTLSELHLPDSRYVRDEPLFLAALEKLAALERAGARLLFGHDAEQWRALNDGPVREITFSALA